MYQIRFIVPYGTFITPDVLIISCILPYMKQLFSLGLMELMNEYKKNIIIYYF